MPGFPFQETRTINLHAHRHEDELTDTKISVNNEFIFVLYIYNDCIYT